MNTLMIVAVSSFMGITAYAGDTPLNTKEWVKDAGIAINEVMAYPSVASHQGVTGTSAFQVTIDRNGDIVNYTAVRLSGKKALDKAAERALNNADFPSIPNTFAGDRLTFTLDLSFRQKESKSRQSYLDAKRSKGAVTGARVALLGGTSIAAAKRSKS